MLKTPPVVDGLTHAIDASSPNVDTNMIIGDSAVVNSGVVCINVPTSHPVINIEKNQWTHPNVNSAPLYDKITARQLRKI